MYRPICTIVLAAFVALLAGCPDSGRNKPSPMPPESNGKSAAQPATAARLGERAAEYWKASSNEDCAGVYRLTDPRVLGGRPESEFCDWYLKNEPFQIHAYTIKRFDVQERMGWVELDYTSTIRQAPNVPPRNATMIHKWHYFQGDWYPVPREELNRYPEAIWRRDANEEAALYPSVQDYWEARLAGDYDKMYAAVTPSARNAVALEQFMRSMSQAITCSYRIEWIEVVNGVGRAMVYCETKLNDPHQRKTPCNPMPPQIDRWVRIDGAWFLDPE